MGLQGLQAAQRVRVNEDIVRQLAALVVQGKLAPGTQTPAESALAEQFGVSRAVVREALRSLELRGLLETSQGRRTVVRHSDYWDILDPLVLSVHREVGLAMPLLRDFVWVRTQLEPEVAAEAARRPSKQFLEELGDCLDRMESSVHDPRAYFTEDMAFHVLVAEAVPNRVLARLMRVIGVLVNESRDISREAIDAPMGALGHHRRIYARLVAADPEGAREAMRDHFEWTTNRLLGQ